MSAVPAVDRRLSRRETHSSRAGSAVVVALLLAVLLLAVGVGCVALLAAHPGQTPPDRLSLRPFDAARPALVGGGVAAALVGVVLVVLGIAPGRLRRRRIASQRMVALVDDGVVADEVADRVCSVLALEPRQVRVLVTHRRATVTVTPISGMPLDTESAQALADETTRRLGVPGGARLVVSDHGVVGR